MKRSKFTGSEIHSILKQTEGGTLVSELCCEYVSKGLEQWAHENQIPLIFIQPGNPQQNAYSEVLMISRNVYQYRPCRGEDTVLRHRIREIAETRVGYGYQRIHVLLQREGFGVKKGLTFAGSALVGMWQVLTEKSGNWPLFLMNAGAWILWLITCLMAVFGMNV